MFSNINRLGMLAVSATVMLVTTDYAHAQCSRGGRGGGSPSAATTSTGSLTPLGLYSNTPYSNTPYSNSGTNLSTARQYAFQQQLIAAQRQAYAVRQQQMQQFAQARLSQQQDLQAIRLARADANRAKRADRIAALKARQRTELDPTESGVMLASTNSSTNPFQ